MIQVNQNICIGCGACANDCPGNVIELSNGKASMLRKCIQCGHCVAICPVNAVAIPKYDMEDVEEYDKATFDISPENMLHTIKFRRSIRKFKAEKIEKAKVQNMLNAGRYTATARNLQGTRFVFVQGQLEEFKKLVWDKMPEIVAGVEQEAPVYAGIFKGFYERWQENHEDDGLFFNTPSMMVVATDNPLDGGLAAANIENMAVTDGLGALYSGYLMRIISACPDLREWLGIGSKGVACCMLLGYPAVTYRRTAPRRQADVILK